MVDITDMSYFVPPPVSMRPSEARGYWKSSKDWRNVTILTLKGWRTMKGARGKVEKTLGKPIGDISNEELAKFIVANEKTKQVSYKTTRDQKTRAESRTNLKRLSTVDDRLKEYLKSYEAITANDMTSLRQLCALEVALLDLERTEHDLLRDLKDRNKKATISESYINSIVNAKMKYLAEYRQLQQMLGIDRQTREKSDADSGGADYTRRLMQDTAQMVESKAVRISCPNCAVSGTILQMGMVLCHFEHWEFSAECPKCHQRFTLNPVR